MSPPNKQDHYGRLAAALHKTKPYVRVGPRGGIDSHARLRMSQWEQDVVAISEVLTKENPLTFNARSFLSACVGEDG